MPPVVTPLYAAALTALFISLSLRVIALRRSGRVSLGDAGDPALLARIRAQGNCAEYAPLGIVLLLLAELAGAARPCCTCRASRCWQAASSMPGRCPDRGALPPAPLAC